MNHKGTKAQSTYVGIARELNDISRTVIDSAFSVHSNLGPGLLESIYEKCFAYELHSRGLRVESQVPVPIQYKDLHLDGGLRIDLLVENELIVELKANDALLPVHEAQLLSYLRLAQKRLGLLINFNVPLIRDGIKRLVI